MSGAAFACSRPLPLVVARGPVPQTPDVERFCLVEEFHAPRVSWAALTFDFLPAARAHGFQRE